LIIVDLQIEILWLKARCLGSHDELVLFVFNVNSPTLRRLVWPGRRSGEAAEKIIEEPIELRT